MASPHPNSRVRVAVLGAASFAEVAHIPGINAHLNADVVALFGRDPARTSEVAARCGVPAITGDLDRILARSDIDAVSIVSSDDMHHPYAMAALRAGKHVFCEKPLALDEAQVGEMAREAAARGVVHHVSFTFRHNHGLSELRRRIVAGDIGRPYYIEIHGEWYRKLDGLTRSWRDDPAKHGYGYLGEMGSHYIDAVNFIAEPLGGYIDNITGITHSMPREGAALDLASALFHTAAGIQGQFLISQATPAPASYGAIHGDGARGHLGYIVVTGDGGALSTSFSRGNTESLRVLRSGSQWDAIDLGPGAYDGTAHSIPIMFARFIDAIITGSDASGIAATFDDGYRAQAAIDAIMRSAATQTWQPVPQQPTK